MMNISHKLQRGFSLVTAIFLLVVLGGLGAMMMTFFTAQQQSSALDVVGTRAYHAARAGIEWGAYQVLQNPGGAFATGCGGAPTALAPGTFLGTLATFDVSVACTVNTYIDGSTVTVYRLTATASRGAAGQADNVERQIEATIAR